MADKKARLVPVLKLGDREYLVDIEKREFIDTNDLNNCISMHSHQGRVMVNEMASLTRNCLSVYPDRQDGMEV